MQLYTNSAWGTVVQTSVHLLIVNFVITFCHFSNSLSNPLTNQLKRNCSTDFLLPCCRHTFHCVNSVQWGAESSMQLHQQAEQAVSTCAVLFLWFNEEAVDCTGKNKASEWLFCVYIITITAQHLNLWLCWFCYKFTILRNEMPSIKQIKTLKVSFSLEPYLSHAFSASKAYQCAYPNRQISSRT